MKPHNWKLIRSYTRDDTCKPARTFICNRRGLQLDTNVIDTDQSVIIAKTKDRIFHDCDLYLISKVQNS